MKILKVINNNVVSCTDKDGQEIVVMGKGLGFQAKQGFQLDEKMVEKIFRMESQNDIDKLKNLFTLLPPEHIRLSDKIISYAKRALTTHLNQNLYLTLTDHVSMVISRVQEGIMVPNGLLSEVRAFYPREFAVGRYALELIEAEFKICLPDDEAASIALHLVNAEYDTSIGQMLQITQVMQELLAIIQQEKGIGDLEDSLYYDELVVHLKFLVMRVFNSEPDGPPDPEFVQAIRSVYPEEFHCANKVSERLEEVSHRQVTQEKRAYLAVNIRRMCRIGDHTRRRADQLAAFSTSEGMV